MTEIHIWVYIATTFKPDGILTDKSWALHNRKEFINELYTTNINTVTEGITFLNSFSAVLGRFQILEFSTLMESWLQTVSVQYFMYISGIVC